MKRLFRYFVQGLILTVPAAVTAYVCYVAFTKIDGWLGVPIPGVGFVATLALITLVGFLGTTVVTRWFLSTFEEALAHLPFVRLVYTSTKDLLNAFVGEKRRFDKPVVVALTPDGAIRGLGYITQESADSLGALESVVVYFPQSYAFAGWTFVVPASRVTRVESVSSDFMAFVVSGGVTDVPKIK
jgi:uncharacterized membrane protein